MTTIIELDNQEKLINWYQKRFPKRKNWSHKRHIAHLMKKLTEEVGELSEAYIAFDEIDVRNRRYEIADVYMLIYLISYYEGIDIDTVVQKKLKVLERRTNKR